jgi:transglutaminase-like putative cysteine protease
MRRFRLPFGSDAQTTQTLHAMRNVVRGSVVEQPIVIETATEIARHVNGRNPAALAAAIGDWCALRVEFLPDPAIDGDVLRTPEHTLREIERHGFARIDCDDAAMLVAALATALGLSCRFVVFAYFDPRAPFSHVATEVDTQRGPVLLNVTEPLSGPAPSRAASLEV